jgi:limonene-1,2-epoxide hydrolase
VGDSENIALVRRWVEAFNRLEFNSAIRDLLDPEAELHEWPNAPGARTYRGRDGVRQALDSWFESWEWMHVEIVDLLEVDDRVLVTLDQRARGKGSKVEVQLRTFNVFTLRAGKVREMKLFTEREPAFQAAGLTPDYQEEKR